MIEWTTATETNNDFFSIEKSADAINFEVLSIVDGAGNSYKNLHYLFFDKQPFATTYYRLKQTDYDGKYEYSAIISVIHNMHEEFVFEIFPNPNESGLFNAKINAEIGQKISIMINDLFGKEVYTTTIYVQEKGTVIYSIVPNNELTSGVYEITAISDQSLNRTKLIIK